MIVRTFTATDDAGKLFGHQSITVEHHGAEFTFGRDYTVECSMRCLWRTPLRRTTVVGHHRSVERNHRWRAAGNYVIVRTARCNRHALKRSSATPDHR